MEATKYTMDLAGHKLSLEFGKYCEQAADHSDGALRGMAIAHK